MGSSLSKCIVLLAVVGTSGCFPAYAPVMSATRIEPPPHVILACAAAVDDPAVAELRRSFPALEIATRADCKAAALVAPNAANCLDATPPCDLPEFIDGEPVAIANSHFDRILVMDLATKTTVETVYTQQSIGGQTGGRRGGGRSTTTTTTNSITAPGRSGVVYVFDPHAATIVGATRVTEATPVDLARVFEKLVH